MIIKLYRHFDEHVETYLSTALILIFSALMILQVFMRHVMGNSLTWSEELSRYAFVWFLYTSASYAVKYQRHVKFNVLVNLIGKKSPITERILRLFALLLWIAFLLFLCYYSVDLVMAQYASGQLSPANKIPMYLVYLGLPLGAFLMTFRVTQHIVRSVQDLIINKNAPIPKARDEYTDLPEGETA